jgi:hypothetical protein
MTNPTSNFGWQMPTNTDLVTDLPADFAVFGQAVDTSMADLLGGTTGQILSKASNTNMDFTWIANDQGDITSVTATSPLTGGGTSGAITVGIQDATTSVKGSVQLSDSTSTTSSVLAATPTAVKAAYDLANAAPAGNLSGTTLKSTVTASSLVSFGASPVIASPKISSTYTAKTAAYTFASGDEGNLFSMNNATTQQFNIPTDATFNFAVGTEINVFWITGAGQPTIGAVTPATTTVISTGATSATPKLRIANSGATCKKLAANSWIVFGDLA